MAMPSLRDCPRGHEWYSNELTDVCPECGVGEWHREDIIWYGTPVRLLPLSVRSLRVLLENNYEYFGQVAKDHALLGELSGLGKVSLAEIDFALAEPRLAVIEKRWQDLWNKRYDDRHGEVA